jgi:hypothetical protein
MGLSDVLDDEVDGVLVGLYAPLGVWWVQASEGCVIQPYATALRVQLYNDDLRDFEVKTNSPLTSLSLSLAHLRLTIQDALSLF